MKVISKEEEAAHYTQVVTGGLIGGTLGLGVGVGGVYLASKRYKAFRGLTIQFKAFLITSSGTFGAMVNAERWSIAFQKAQDPRRSYVDGAARTAQIIRENESAYQRFLEYAREHRYTIVFCSWLASMGVAFAMVNRSPQTTANKIVQARVYAQALTLAVLLISMGFETHDAKHGRGRWQTVMVLDPNDPEHKHLIEKRVHKEEYEGQDLWMDMVAAEERRLANKNAATKE